jgi:ankyrin repeat protein
MIKLLIACWFVVGWLPAFGNDEGCSPSVRYLSTFRWANSSERTILPKRAVVRGDIVLSPDEKLFIYETGTTTITFPHSGQPKAEFKIVSGRKELLQVALTKLPELKPDPVFAGGLRPTFAARLCPADGQNMVVVASGSGATGEGQFFLVFVGGNGQYHSFHLPIAKKGRVEVSAKRPDTFRLWSVVDSEDLGTAPHYEVSVYKLGKDGFHLVSTTKTKQGYGPGEFVNNPIVLKGNTSRSSTPPEQHGHVGVVAADALVSQQGEAQETLPPLVLAAKKGNWASVQSLLAGGANINTSSSEGATALHYAANDGNLAVVEVLLRAHADVNARTNDGYTPLHSAVHCRDVRVVRALLAAGADVNARTENNVTPLILSIDMAWGKPEITLTLIQAGADVNIAESPDGDTALWIATTESALEVMEALLKKGANPNLQPRNGYTPLHIAAMNGLVDEVKLLLRYGAKPMIRDAGGRTPLDVTSNKRPEIKRLLESSSEIGK